MSNQSKLVMLGVIIIFLIPFLIYRIASPPINRFGPSQTSQENHSSETPSTVAKTQIPVIRAELLRREKENPPSTLNSLSREGLHPPQSASSTPTTALTTTPVAVAPSSDKPFVEFEWKGTFEAMGIGPNNGYYGICPDCKSPVYYQSKKCHKCGTAYQWTTAEKTCPICKGQRKDYCDCNPVRLPANNPEVGKCFGPYISGLNMFKGCLKGKCDPCDGKGIIYAIMKSETKTCPFCQGTGICSACKGSGICSICKGTGIKDCDDCGGQGVVIVGDTPYPAERTFGYRKKI